MDYTAPRLAGRVLVVEDHPVNQQVLAFQLDELGLEYDLADDGQAALDLLARHAYDVVLMDWQMPGMDGDEATRRIRQNPEFASLPVVAITAHDGDAFRAACRAAGASAYLGKPYDEDQLVALLARWLSPAGAAPARVDGWPAPVGPAGNAIRPSLLDHAALAARYPGNPAILEQLDGMFHATSLEGLAALRQCAADRDTHQLAREAHKLRGGAASVLAYEVQRLAGELEAAAKNADWTRVDACLADLTRLFA